jgi:uncharacterized protein
VDRIFLDANVLFSAAYRSDARLARLWQLEGVELVTSAYAAEEARLNLTQEDQRARLAKLLEKVCMTTDVAHLPAGVDLPEGDRPILQAALHARATHLLTGDKKHFGRLFGRRFGGVLVLAPAEFFERRKARWLRRT